MGGFSGHQVQLSIQVIKSREFLILFYQRDPPSAQVLLPSSRPQACDLHGWEEGFFSVLSMEGLESVCSSLCPTAQCD